MQVDIPLQITGTVQYTYAPASNCWIKSPAASGSIPITMDAIRSRMNDRDILFGTDDFVDGLSEYYPSIFVCRVDAGSIVESPGFSAAEALIPIAWDMNIADGLSEVSSDWPGFSRSLDLACRLQSGSGGAVPVVVPPDSGLPWPMTIDHTKTALEIAALKTEPGGFNAGITQFRMGTIHLDIDWGGNAAKFGGGACFFAEKISTSAGRISIFIAREYPVGSCEYNAVLEHEQKHYESFSYLLRQHFDELREQFAERLWNIPTKKKPAYAASYDAGVAQAGVVIQRLIQARNNLLVERMREETALLERETGAVHAKCTNW